MEFISLGQAFKHQQAGGLIVCSDVNQELIEKVLK